MADLYSYCRKDIHSLYQYFGYVFSFSIVPVIVTETCFFSSEYEGMTREDGQPYGFFTSGILGLLPMILTHYIILIVLFNNYDVMFLLMFPLAFSWWLWVAAFDDATPGAWT